MPFTRFSIAGDAKAGDAGTPARFPPATEFAGYRILDDKFLDPLAEEVVNQVRLRGPFLSLAEFVNRQLSSGDLALAGTLQAALNAVTKRLHHQPARPCPKRSRPLPSPHPPRRRRGIQIPRRRRRLQRLRPARLDPPGRHPAPAGPDPLRPRRHLHHPRLRRCPRRRRQYPGPRRLRGGGAPHPRLRRSRRAADITTPPKARQQNLRPPLRTRLVPLAHRRGNLNLHRRLTTSPCPPASSSSCCSPSPPPPRNADRTCRILFLGAPDKAPEKLQLFDGAASREVELPRMSFSPVYQLRSGAGALALLPSLPAPADGGSRRSSRRRPGPPSPKTSATSICSSSAIPPTPSCRSECRSSTPTREPQAWPELWFNLTQTRSAALSASENS